MFRRGLLSVVQPAQRAFLPLCLSAVPKNISIWSVGSTQRYCSTGSPPDALRALHDACGKELIEEQASDRVDAPLPDGWAYTHTPGTGYFTLTRTSPLPMEIFCRTEDPSPESATDGDSVPRGYPFTARITRNKKTCEMYCVAVEDELEIRTFRIFSTARTHEDFISSDRFFQTQLAYEGPDLTHMDEGFMQTLFSCLEAHGVDDALAAFIIKKAEATEQEEYERWLSELKSFSA